MACTPSMTITFWGVRGSIPSPGATTVRYGGNTSCVSVDLGTEYQLVFDAGTGIRAYGQAVLQDMRPIFVVLSHAHWDHIQGFPFFQPLYQPDRTIYAFPDLLGRSVLCSSLAQMDGAHFPVKANALPSRIQCVTTGGLEVLRAHGFAVTQIATNHPGGGTGYRLEHGGKSLVYLTDNELAPPGPLTTTFDEFVTFCRHADVLIHDAQYLATDMPAKHGWGHSLVPQAGALAVAAEVAHLVLFHHDPDRSDEEIDCIQTTMRDDLSRQAHRLQCTAAFEGMCLQL